ncbi:MAG: DedA family protein [Deltaproteobacteria bacterium]|nr:DedA family protein [Deltaproteobacteria bacterium]
MNAELQWLLDNGSYLALFVYLLAAGVGFPVPEDIAMIAGGILLHRQVVEPIPLVAVLASGVLIGDMIIFTTARRWGPTAADHPFIARFLPPQRRQQLEKLFDRYGGLVVFMARQVAGIRAPIFALAGIHQMKPRLFLLWDSLALLVSAPLWMGLGYLFSDQLDEAMADLHQARLKLIVGGVLVLLVVWAVHRFTKKVTSNHIPVPAPQPKPPQTSKSGAKNKPKAQPKVKIKTTAKAKSSREKKQALPGKARGVP